MNNKIELGQKVSFSSEIKRNRKESRWIESIFDKDREGIIVGIRTLNNGKWVDRMDIVGEYPGEPEYYTAYEPSERFKAYIIAWSLSRRFCYVLINNVKIIQ